MLKFKQKRNFRPQYLSFEFDIIFKYFRNAGSSNFLLVLISLSKIETFFFRIR